MGQEKLNDGRTEHVAGTAITIDTTWQDGTAILSVAGDIDMQTAGNLSDAIATAVAESPTGVIVDLSVVEFLASAGMTVLIATQGQLEPATRFAVVADGPGTSRPIHLMGVDAVVRVYAKLPDALNDFAIA